MKWFNKKFLINRMFPANLQKKPEINTDKCHICYIFECLYLYNYRKSKSG